MRDVLGQIAQARAALMMRGAENMRLRLCLGLTTHETLRAEIGPTDTWAWGSGKRVLTILRMPYEIYPEMEGFAVLATGADRDRLRRGP